MQRVTLAPRWYGTAEMPTDKPALAFLPGKQRDGAACWQLEHTWVHAPTSLSRCLGAGSCWMRWLGGARRWAALKGMPRGCSSWFGMLLPDCPESGPPRGSPGQWVIHTLLGSVSERRVPLAPHPPNVSSGF